MGEIRIVGPGKTRGYPYPVCKKTRVDCNLFMGLLFCMITLKSCHTVYVMGRDSTERFGILNDVQQHR